MADTDQDALETRLKKLRNPEAHPQQSDEEDDDSPAGELSVQARVDSVALAKGRLSSGAGTAPNKDRLEREDRSSLPPSGLNRRQKDTDKQKATGFKGVTRKLKSSLGFGDKDKADVKSNPPELASHVSFNDRVEELPVTGGTH